jgi:aspartyl-tRNA synthetase
MQRTHTVLQLTDTKEGAEVVLSGWVHRRRDHGPITFIDLRNRQELVQVVVRWKDMSEKEVDSLKESLKPESVVEVKGKVVARRPGSENEEISTGKIEVVANEVKVINEAQTPPFVLDEAKSAVGEETRMKYRYLDLRRQPMQKNLKLRHDASRAVREFLWQQDFIEVETPILSKSTPEGARDYLVPSRVHGGKFFALPQSPQQYKQLLMVAGIEKYFQIVRCFRDEDQRGDRQPEFTQVDIEASFVEREDILEMVEKMFIEVVKKVAPEKTFTAVPFPRMSYAEAMEKYGNDRPDIRKNTDDPNELGFCWVLDFPMFERKDDGTLGAVHHPFTMPQVDSVEELRNAPDPTQLLAHQYDLALNGSEICGGSIRTHDPELLQATFEVLGHSVEDIQAKFGHLLEAFKYGVPPHGGIACGFDRFVAILAGETSIREVIAFPKNDKAKDPMMDSPSGVSPEQLQELSIRVVKK